MTENGSIKTVRISNESALTAYRKKFKIISLVMLIVGALGTAAYIVLGTVWEMKFDAQPGWIDAFLAFTVPLTLGLIGYITVIRLNRRALLEALSSTCEFYNNCFFYSYEGTDNNPVTVKILYSEALKRRGNEKYGYVYVFKTGSFLAFGKADLTCEELNTLNKLFYRPLEEGVGTVELKEFKEEDKDKNELSRT